MIYIGICGGRMDVGFLLFEQASKRFDVFQRASERL